MIHLRASAESAVTNVVGITVSVAVLAALALGFAGVTARHAQGLSGEIKQLRAASTEAAEQTKRDAQKIAALEKKAKAFSTESAALREQVKTLRAAAASAPHPSPATALTDPQSAPAPSEKQPKQSAAGFLEKMMGNPETKKAMVKQQMLIMRQFYGDLMKQLHLTPQQADQFQDILTQRQTVMMDSGMKMLQDPGSASTQDLLTQQESINQSFKDMLGADGFSAFQKYAKTLGARAQIWQLNQQMSGAGTALNDSQSQGLMQIISDESSRAPEPFKANDPQALGAAASMSDAVFQQSAKNQAEVDRRVRLRAMGILTQDQLKALESMQTQTLEMQKASIQMMRSKGQ